MPSEPTCITLPSSSWSASRRPWPVALVPGTAEDRDPAIRAMNCPIVARSPATRLEESLIDPESWPSHDPDTARRRSEQVSSPAYAGYSGSRQEVVTMIGQNHVPSLVGVSARNNDKMHEIKFFRARTDCFLPQPARLPCTAQSSSQQSMPQLTDSAWHANVNILLHWRVEECDSDVVDT